MFWLAEVPISVDEDRKVETSSKVVDAVYNSQVEVSDHICNVQGLSNNS